MKTIQIAVAFAIAALFPSAYAATVLHEDFTGSAISGDWTSINGACLTAGNISYATALAANPAGTPAGTYIHNIPQCSGLPYYSPPPLHLPQAQVGLSASNTDAAHSGALRLTNGGSNINQTGAIISTTSIPKDNGLQVTFSTYTYGGNNFYGTGADGLAFYLIDGQVAKPLLGSFGGSLGYSCSSGKAGGMVGGYLGLGIDELGNYLRAADNTSTGLGFQPGTIGLRGRGEVNWTTLNANYNANYPNTLTGDQQLAAVRNTCGTGTLWNYADPSKPSDTGTAVADYNMLVGANLKLPAAQPIANEKVTVRTAATPISYNIKITSAGLLNFGYYYNGGSYQPIVVNQDLVATNGPLPASYKFGFGGSSGGGTNVHEIMCFSADPLSTSSSISVNTTQSGEFRTGIQTYLAGYRAENWTGQLAARSLLANTDGTIGFATNANWDAACVLAGGGCDSMGLDSNGNATNNIAVQAPASRSILTWNGTQGIPFQWASLSTPQQAALTAAATTTVATATTPIFSPMTTGQNILAFLRGDRTQEQTAGVLRKRYGVLGDIVDASPVAVGGPVQNYPSTWTDKLYGTTVAEGTSYKTFTTNNTTRLNVVYNGANDGLVHGFRSGSYATDGSYVDNITTPNDGKEVLAYMPNSMLIKAAKLANPLYSHDYYISATPGTGDLYYGAAWHTWLVGGLGAGGSAIYALDITNPANFSEANASSLIKGEWDAASITCNVANCNNNLGNTYGTPIIRRLHNGQWAVIFGNGFGSSSGKAGIYIGLVDATSGAVTYRWLDTGSTASANGIAYVTSADLDADRITDYLYAGDLNGNVWRFDLTSTNQADWAVSKYGNASGTPLFQTGMPITTKINLAVATARKSRLMVMFATGQKTPLTSTSAETYATGQQSVYGIWDWDMNAWDNGATTADATAPVVIAPSRTQYIALAGPQTLSKTTLLQQTITTSGDYRTLSNNLTVNWSTGGTGQQFGWYVDLPTSNEQSVYNAIIVGNNLQLNTSTPAVTGVVSCTPLTAVTWQMAFNVLTGGGNAESFFRNADGTYTATGLASTQGMKTSALGSSWTIYYKGKGYLISNTANGNATAGSGAINPTGRIISTAISGWRQMR